MSLTHIFWFQNRLFLVPFELRAVFFYVNVTDTYQGLRMWPGVERLGYTVRPHLNK